MIFAGRPFLIRALFMRQKCPEYVLERSEVSGGLPKTFSEVREGLPKQTE